MLKKSLFQKKPLAVLKIVYFSLSIVTSVICPTQLLAQGDTSLFVPIILSSSGENGSFFTSELTLTNRGATNVTLDYTYTASFGGGTGLASDSISARQQRIIPDAIVYLKSLGVPIPDSGDRGGTLSVRTHNLASLFDFAITVRTTTAEPEGRAGMTYVAVRPSEALYDPVYLFGLRQDASDRSNVAVENIGSPDQGYITLRLTAFSGDSSFQQALPDIALPPGGWSQISGILHSNGLSLSNGYVRVERLNGTAPYYAYAVINDQANSDSSFIQPVMQEATHGNWVLPVVVETEFFSSELVVTNLFGHQGKMFFYYSDEHGILHAIPVGIPVDTGQQVIIPNLAEYLGIPKPFVGTLFAANCIDVDNCYPEEPGLWLGVRTFSTGSGGRYGVFYKGVPYGAWTPSDVWLYDLQQDGGNRTNLALVNTGDGAAGFRVELFDGNTGQKVNTVDDITVDAFQWRQIGNILAQSGLHTSQGYAHVTSTSGSNSFVTYAVINDGGQPGTGTGDGAFIASSQSADQPHLSIASSDRIEGFCWQVNWILELSNAPPNTPIQLVGGSNGVPSGFDLPKGAKTDFRGNFSARGPIGRPSGTYNLSVLVGGQVSNTVSVQIVGDCN